MFIFIVISAVLAISGFHALLMKSVEDFNYGGESPSTEWREFERLKNGVRF